MTRLIWLLFVFRLKRTTDVMFGGKQVLVCGFGEVRNPISPLTFIAVPSRLAQLVACLGLH